MKILMIILVLLTGFSASAQERKQRERHRTGMDRTELTPEQSATLHSKKMTLALDLNEKQREKIYALELEKAQNRKGRRTKGSEKKKLSDEERFQRRSERLDQKIHYKESLREILNKDQLAKWERLNQGRLRSGHRKGNKRKQKGQ